MSLPIVALDMISAIYLLIILIGIQHIKGEKTAQTKTYIFCVWICFISLVVDSLFILSYGRIKNDFVITLIYSVPNILVDFLNIGFAFYIVTLFRERKLKYAGLYLRISLFLYISEIVFMTVGTLTRKIFFFENGRGFTGSWANYAFILSAVSVFLFVAFMAVNIKALGIRNVLTLAIYVVMPAITGALWLLGVKWISSYIGYAMALMIIFVMIQFKIISETSLKAEIYNALSVRDVLTGLRNRRGYEECLASIPPEASVFVVFCDINSLKAVNDRLGHDAGDERIKKMADILRKLFADNEIFRISGDEFVGIIQDPEKKNIPAMVGDLNRYMSYNDRIASVGCETGEGKNVLDVVKAAEQKMYSEKEKYYMEMGKDRRT